MNNGKESVDTINHKVGIIAFIPGLASLTVYINSTITAYVNSIILIFLVILVSRALSISTRLFLFLSWSISLLISCMELY